MPPAVQQSLRDAHARLGTSQVVLLRPSASAMQVGIPLDRSGRAIQEHNMARCIALLLRRARLAAETLHVFCRDLEMLRRAGLSETGEEALRAELGIWGLEGLAWRQQQQRRRGSKEDGGRWERRGGAGRRGRRRREPGVVFELGPWGEERRALPHEEAAWVLMESVGL